MGEEKRQIGMGWMERRADGIIHTIVDFMDGDVQGLAAEYIATRNELARGDRLPTLIEIRDVPFVERTARAFLMSQVAGVPCRAVVATDPSFVTIWKSFQLVDSSGVPAEIFSNVDRALNGSTNRWSQRPGASRAAAGHRTLPSFQNPTTRRDAATFSPWRT